MIHTQQGTKLREALDSAGVPMCTQSLEAGPEGVEDAERAEQLWPHPRSSPGTAGLRLRTYGQDIGVRGVR